MYCQLPAALNSPTGVAPTGVAPSAEILPCTVNVLETLIRIAPPPEPPRFFEQSGEPNAVFDDCTRSCPGPPALPHIVGSVTLPYVSPPADVAVKHTGVAARYVVTDIVVALLFVVALVGDT